MVDIKLTIGKDDKKIVFEAPKNDVSQSSYIERADVEIDTVNKGQEVRQKSRDVHAVVHIVGRIDTAINKQLKAVSQWALDFNSEGTYRDVVVEVNDEGKKTTYFLPSMFVMNFDYRNRADKEESKPYFELKLMQKENMLGKIDIDCGE